MLFKDTFEDIATSFNSWVDSDITDATYVSNLVLEYANRAQESLLSEAALGWQYLTKTVQLSLSGLTAALPSDYGLLINCYADTDSDGKPDFYYFKDGELLEGFKLLPNFTKSAGHAFSIQFYQNPLEPLFIDYQTALEDFTGEGTEYSFFPHNLIFRKMQHLRCLDKGMLDEWKALSTDFKIEMDKFKSQHQNIAGTIGIQVNDSRGFGVRLPRNNLSSYGASSGRMVGKTNDQDIYRRR